MKMSITSMLRSERGVSLIIAAIMMIVLLGMAALAVDVGRLYVARQYLQNSCDASALAGGIELPDQAKATDKAAECADANHLLHYQISFPADGMTADGPTKLRVDSQLTVPHTFARVLGFISGPVSAYAVVLKVAGVGWVSQRVVPWGIPWYTSTGEPYTYATGQLYTLKLGSQSDLQNGSVARTGSNFYPLALERSLGDGSSGGSVYRTDVTWGFPGTVKVGDVTETEPGNMVGPTRQAVVTDADSLFNRAAVSPWADDTYDNFDYGNSRIVIVPIIGPMGTGRTEVTILGFASFYVESFTSQEVKGYFIEYTIPGAGGTGTYYGVSTFRLIE
jgi:hypothetical protein